MMHRSKSSIFSQLKATLSTSSLQLDTTTHNDTISIKSRLHPSVRSQRISTKPFEYEDVFLPEKPIIQPYKLTDILARESDVIISNQITPLTEYRGYAIYMIISIFHFIWLCWTFIPNTILNRLGIYYYPSRWWSIGISSFILMGMLCTYIGLQLWNIEYETIPLDDIHTIIDEDAVIEKDWEKYAWEDTNGVYDLTIVDVNKILYDDDEEVEVEDERDENLNETIQG